jgi:hypothetical protein
MSSWLKDYGGQDSSSGCYVSLSSYLNSRTMLTIYGTQAVPLPLVRACRCCGGEGR